MKKGFLLTLGFLALSLMFALLMGCQGKDGKDGLVGPAGQDANANCTQCHADDQTIVAKEWQWSGTLHAVGTSFEEEKDRQSCARCHSGTGYISFVKGEANYQTYSNTTYRVDTVGGVAMSPDTLTNATNVNCRTCHEIHNTYTSADWKLTNTSAVKLFIDSTQRVDLGKGNLCANCHQSRTNPRTSVDSIAVVGRSVDSVKTGSRWGGHNGPQLNVLAAIGGWEGADTGRAKASAIAHKATVNNGCVACHVSAASGMDHRFEPVVAGCNTATCHGGSVKYSSTAGYMLGSDSVQVKFQRLMNQVRDTLLVYGTVDTASAAAKATPEGVVSVAKKVPRDVAGLTFNYGVVLKDKSKGVHNLDYAKYLLQSGLVKLGATPVY